MKNKYLFSSICLIALLVLGNLAAFAQTPAVEVIQPSLPNIKWVAGTTNLISWEDNFVKPVNIDLMNETGSEFIQSIIAGVEGSTYPWNTTGIPKGNYTIRVSSSVNGSYKDISDNYFSIVESVGSYVHVIQPNVPGIKWLKGTKNLISWEDDLPENVNIQWFFHNEIPAVDLFATNFDTFTTGDQVACTDGTHWTTWSLSPCNTKEDPVFSTDYDRSGGGNSVKVWNDNDLVLPMGDKTTGKYEITFWMYIPLNNGGYYNILQKFDGNNSGWGMHFFFTDAGTANLHAGGVITSVSYPKDEWFKLTNTIDLDNDVAEVKLNNTTVYSWQWSLIDAQTGLAGLKKLAGVDFYSGKVDGIGIVNPLYYLDDVSFRIPAVVYEDFGLLAQNVTGTTWEWPIDATLHSSKTNTDVNALGNHYKIRVSGNLAGSPGDYSDNEFAIVESLGGTVKVIQPSLANIKWLRGTKHLISWEDELTEPVNIQLFRYNESGIAVSNEVIASDITESTWEWTIPTNQILSDHYKIRISGNLAGSPGAFSDNEFAIVESLGGKVNIIQPNLANIKWLRGTKNLISWEDELTEPVNIQLFRYNESGTMVSNEVIAWNVHESTWEWTIPATQPLSDYYKIRISGNLSTSPDDYSDHYFSIVESLGTAVKLIQPTISGIKWMPGSSHLISWEDDLSESVNIQLFRYDGSGNFLSNDVIASNISGSTWEWTIDADQPVGNYYKIRISGTLPTSPGAYSENYFSIVSSLGTNVNVIQPNIPGIEWYVGTSHLISWEDDLSESVNIQLFRYDGSGNVLSNDVIASNIYGTTWEWNIPESQAIGDYCKIRISGSLPGSPGDYSDNYFKLIQLIDAYIYPNPCDQSMSIEFPDNNTQNFTIDLFDRFGTRVASKSLNTAWSKQVTLSTSDLPNGVYFLNMTAGDTRISKKVIVQH